MIISINAKKKGLWRKLSMPYYKRPEETSIRRNIPQHHKGYTLKNIEPTLF
jgi:hypothetical protein